LNYSVTIQEVVDQALNKPAFGMSFYQSPSNEMLLKKIPFGRGAKGKNYSFAEMAQRKKSWIPGPHYNVLYDWTAE